MEAKRNHLTCIDNSPVAWHECMQAGGIADLGLPLVLQQAVLCPQQAGLAPGLAMPPTFMHEDQSPDANEGRRQC